jgi:hypothetical protein
MTATHADRIDTRRHQIVARMGAALANYAYHRDAADKEWQKRVDAAHELHALEEAAKGVHA